VLALLVSLARSVSGVAVNALIKLGWPLLLLAYAILRALWVRFPRPDGVAVTRAQAPALFTMVEELRRKLACPRFHHVLLTAEWNAAVAQRPRLGPFGWYENYLQLGLPLMTGLSLDEFRAVLAHELGHLSRNHGRFGSWIYRIRATWGRLLESLHQARHHWRGLFEGFSSGLLRTSTRIRSCSRGPGSTRRTASRASLRVVRAWAGPSSTSSWAARRAQGRALSSREAVLRCRRGARAMLPAPNEAA